MQQRPWGCLTTGGFSLHSSESRLLLSPLSCATRTCIFTRFSSPSRLNLVHGPHIPTSRLILRSLITAIIPSSSKGNSKVGHSMCRFVTLTFYLHSPAEQTFKSLASAYPGRHFKPDSWFIYRSMYPSNYPSKLSLKISVSFRLDQMLCNGELSESLNHPASPR